MSFGYAKRSALIIGLLCILVAPLLAQSPTPTAIDISGSISYCSSPGSVPVPNVTLNLTGDVTTSTVSDGSGNYQFSSLAAGGTYTVTPSKGARTPSSAGINTMDVIATQRHYLQRALLSGCGLTAADVNGDGRVDTIDVLAIQQFFLGLPPRIANVGKYQFSPASRTYPGLVSDQAAQNYNAIVFGDVAPAFVEQTAFFDPNANGVVWVITLQPDGKILIGGSFTNLTPNGGATVTRNHIARLMPDGAVDPVFNPNANSSVNSMVVQPDGKIVVGGAFTSIGGQVRNYIARLDATTGVADSSFNPNADGPFQPEVISLAVQADGENWKILVGGQFANIGGQPRNGMARLDATTGLADLLFDPNVQGDSYHYVRSIVVQADGKILIGGLFFVVSGQVRPNFARLNHDGTLDTEFNPGASGAGPESEVFSVAVQPDTKILLAGTFTNVGGQMRNHLARVDATTGTPDSWNPDPPPYPIIRVHSLAVQPDGKVLAGGNFNTSAYTPGLIGGQPRNSIARFDPETGLADSFNPNANGRVWSIAVQPDGKILVGGSFSSIGGQLRNGIAELDATGLAD